MTILEAYEKYKHLDHLLSDREWCGDTLQCYILCDLWRAVKAEAQRQKATETANV